MIQNDSRQIVDKSAIKHFSKLLLTFINYMDQMRYNTRVQY